MRVVSRLFRIVLHSVLLSLTKRNSSDTDSSDRFLRLRVFDCCEARIALHSNRLTVAT